jgi:hypothetical protein
MLGERFIDSSYDDVLLLENRLVLLARGRPQQCLGTPLDPNEDHADG